MTDLKELLQWPRFLAAIKHHRFAAASLFLIVGFFFTVSLLRQRPVYTAEVKMEFASAAPEVSLDNRSLWRYSSYVLQNLFLKGQQIIITSEPVLSRVVTSLNLADAVKEPEKFQNQQHQIASALSVEQINDSQIFLIRARHGNAKMAQDIANTTAEAYIRYTYEKKVDSYKTSTEWLDEKLVDLKAKLERSQRDLVDFIEKEKLTTFSATSVGSNEDAGSLTSAPSKIMSDAEMVLRELRGRKVEEELRLQRMKEKYLPTHPDYQKSENEIALLTRKIADEESQLRSLGDQREKEVIRARKNEIEYSILNREVEVNKELYNALIRKHKETDIGSAILQTDANIIERASLPTAASSPSKLLQLLVAWFLSLVIAVSYCILREVTDTTLKTPSDLERNFKLPLLSLIPRYAVVKENPADDAPFMASDADPRVGEAFRILRTNLNFSFPKEEHGRLIMIGSTVKGEGKSTVSVNLARMNAEQDRRTLLIDADLRARSLTRHFNMQQDVGLTSFLIGETTLKEICRPTSVNNLWVIPAGQEPPQPSTLLDSDAMRALLKKVANEFDEVILDAPPIGMVIDAAILASMVDAVMMIVEAGKTSRHGVHKALATLEKVKVRVCGMVLNKGDVTAQNNYPYVNHYAEYYGVDQQPNKAPKAQEQPEKPLEPISK